MQLSSFSIIRVGGTSYSGSTALDLMLANADDAFSCGEIDALFRPYRMHHFEPECGCGNPDCNIWREIRAAGEAGWPQAVARLFPQVSWIVDSSKDINWMFDQNNIAADAGIPVHNLLIWKTPADYAYSLFKRGKIKGWLRRYMLYHQRYLSIVDDWIGVPYADLAAQPAATLQSLCAYLGMACQDGREQYWTRQHHTLFGNHSAKLHLHDKNTDNYKSIAQDLKSLKPVLDEGGDREVTRHKSIYYGGDSLEKLPPDVVKEIETTRALHDLVASLEQNTVSRVSPRSNSAVRQVRRSVPGIWYYYLDYKRRGYYFACALRRSCGKSGLGA